MVIKKQQITSTGRRMSRQCHCVFLFVVTWSVCERVSVSLRLFGSNYLVLFPNAIPILKNNNKIKPILTKSLLALGS